MIINNYIASSWRHILRHKLFSAINILGLAIGLAAVMLIALFVRDELSYDKFWEKSDRVYRAHTAFTPTGRDSMHFVSTPGPVIHAFKKDFTQIEHAARLLYTVPTMKLGDDSFVERVTLVDPDFINIFDFKVIDGDIKAALDQTNGLILSKTQADKFFPNENPIGKVITADFDLFIRDYNVVAVIEDVPENSRLIVNAMALLIEEDWDENPWLFRDWYSVDSQLFYSLPEGVDNAPIEDQMTEFVNRNFPDPSSADPERLPSSLAQLTTLPLRDLHLKSIGMGNRKELGNINTVLTFTAIAILILLIASINFMNLSTARASRRAKEVSLRKVLGSSRKDLVVQFLGESVALTIVGLLIALTMVEISLPIYNEILGKELVIDYMSTDILMLFILAIIVGLAGGVYPAFILSSFRPAQILKANQSAEPKSSTNLRAALVIIQFTVSIALFVSTAVVYGQMQFARNIDLGYDRENILLVGGIGREQVGNDLEFLVEEVKRMPEVGNVSWSTFLPGQRFEHNISVRTEDKTAEDYLLVSHRQVGYDFFKTYDIDLVLGRAYAQDRPDERPGYEDYLAGNMHRASVVINEQAARQLGFSSPQAALGQTIYAQINDTSERYEVEYEIIGITPNIHLESLKRNIRAEIFPLRTDYARALSIRFEGDIPGLINKLETLWQQRFPGIPFEYELLSNILMDQYRDEQGQATVFAAFSGLSILIAGLGLYGLASFTTERRTKEIGIRKVLGANVVDIVKLLLWQFSKPVMIANLVAWPLSFYAMSRWLESFAYRIDDVLIIAFCLGAGGMTLLIAWATVASNSIRVARTNPIKALRYE